MPAPLKQRGVNVRYAVVLGLILASLFGLLLQLASLQVVHGASYRRRSDAQSIRVLWVPALRGKIYDRKMQVLADNRISYDVELMVSDLKPRQLTNTVRDLSVLLRLPERAVWSNLMPRTHFPYTPARVAQDVSFHTMLQVAERLNEFPGVDVAVNPLRDYPFGEGLCHALGYVGNVQPGHPMLVSNEYSIHDLVGKIGVEDAFESKLHGRNGQRIVQVDRGSRFVETLSLQSPMPGQDVVLTIDMKLQRALETAFSNRTGAAVALDPRNGDVLALVSSPGFNLNTFLDDYPARIADAERPLLNRATCGQYQLGSVFKLVTAIAALESGIITPKTVFQCNGSFELGDMKVTDFHKSRHGSITVTEALRVSCNSFFSSYSVMIGVGRLTQYAGLFRFGAQTGIEVPEKTGLLPTPRWKKDRREQNWYVGDTVNLAIGQGFLLVTPLQVAGMVATIANGGTWYPPHLVRGVFVGNRLTLVPPSEPPVPVLKAKRETLDTIRRGMWEVVNERNGSGRLAFLPNITIAGKTGSAMQGDQTFGWFAGYAPFDDPQIAIAVVVEHADTGGRDAAPIVRRAIAAYFDLDAAAATNHTQQAVIID